MIGVMIFMAQLFMNLRMPLIGSYVKIIGAESKVKESWARGVQWAIGSLRYPDYEGGPIIRPDYTQVVVDMIDNRAPLDSFGIPIDINNGSEILKEDDVTGYTIRHIEDVLSSTSTSVN